MTDVSKFEQTGTVTGTWPEGQVIGKLKSTGLSPVFMNELKAGGFDLGVKIFSE
jgi:hypothetical protein